MTDDEKPRSNGAECTLQAEEASSLDQADRWVLEAMAELGAAYLQHKAAEAAFAKSKACIAACTAAAAEAEKQRSTILAVVARELDLPPGTWTYDAKQGKLLKEGSNAEPT